MSLNWNPAKPHNVNQIISDQYGNEWVYDGCAYAPYHDAPLIISCEDKIASADSMLERNYYRFNGRWNDTTNPTAVDLIHNDWGLTQADWHLSNGTERHLRFTSNGWTVALSGALNAAGFPQLNPNYLTSTDAVVGNAIANTTLTDEMLLSGPTSEAEVWVMNGCFIVPCSFGGGNVQFRIEPTESRTTEGKIFLFQGRQPEAVSGATATAYLLNSIEFGIQFQTVASVPAIGGTEIGFTFGMLDAVAAAGGIIQASLDAGATWVDFDNATNIGTVGWGLDSCR